MASIVQKLGAVLPPTPGAWDAFSTAAPIVWKEQDQYYMLYQGWKKPEEGNWKTKPGRLLGLAMSEDGIHWEKYHGNPVMTGDPDSWDRTGFEAGCLLKIEDEYRLYYTGICSGVLRIGLSFSKDLKTWKKYDGNPVLDIGSPNKFDATGTAFPAVLKEKDGWKMIYGGYGPLRRGAPIGIGQCQLGLATSADGLTWTKYAYNPVYRARTWDYFDAHIEVHQTFSLGDYYVTLHEAYGRGGRINIAVIYSPDLKVWARCPENPLFPMTCPSVRQEVSVCHPWLFLEDMVLYHVKVPKPSVVHQHVVNATKIKSELLSMYSQRSLSFPLWINRKIGTKGEISSAIPCETFGKKTFSFVSDRDGTLNIEFDPAGFGRWMTFKEFFVKSENPLTEVISHNLYRIRLKFTPIAKATVSAYLLLEKS
jgi:predicted GH43/DUF377 family glycosyl hydrolase